MTVKTETGEHVLVLRREEIRRRDPLLVVDPDQVGEVLVIETRPRVVAVERPRF